MLLCQICNINPQTPLLTKCCKLFICQCCRQKYEKTGCCICNKTINKKIYCTNSQQLFQIMQDFHSGKPQECYRCSQYAEFQCKDCQMLFCKECNKQVHAGIGFSKHRRENYKFSTNNKTIMRQSDGATESLNRIKRKQEWCANHRQIHQFICQCGISMCLQCQRNHKQICQKPGSKIRSLKQYKEQYFSQILFKIKQITEFKDKLIDDRKSYDQHFEKQKQVFLNCQKSVEQQLDGLKKILQIKSDELKRKIKDYWDSCQKVYKKNQFIIEYNLKKFDDYARVVEKFVQQRIGLDYLEKRVKRVHIGFDFFSFKTLNVEQVQASILNLNFSSKNWQLSQQDNIILNLEAPSENVTGSMIGRQKKNQNAGSVTVSSQFLQEISQNPLIPRPLNLIASHNAIHFDFLHLPFQKDQYEVEYGVGFKMKGQEIFKRIDSKNGSGLVQGLNPSTKYRVRMRVKGGKWGQIVEIKTLDVQKFSVQNLLFAKTINENVFQMLKAGAIYGTNQISFGIHQWELKITNPKHTYDESERACISVGVSNIDQKKPIFVGSTLNYGFQRSAISIRVSLNCELNRLVISSSTNPNQEEVFQNLPSFPIFPSIINKDNNTVQIQYNFISQ